MLNYKHVYPFRFIGLEAGSLVDEVCDRKNHQWIREEKGDSQTNLNDSGKVHRRMAVMGQIQSDDLLSV